MRKAVISLAVLGALCLAYVAWPFASLYGVVRAAQRNDVAAVAQHIDGAALRRSLTAQLIDTYARITGRASGRSGLMASVAASFTDPLVEKLIASASIAEIMRSGWSVPLLGDRPAGLEGLELNALGSVWQLYLGADYGLGEVRFPVPVSRPKEKQFRVRLALSGWTWKLAGLDLPFELQERLVRELIKQENLLDKSAARHRLTRGTARRKLGA
jgi:hypothetical protein